METYILVALFIALIWGISPILYKHLLDRYHPISIIVFVSIVYIGCVFVLGCYNHKTVLEDCNKIGFDDMFWVFIVSITGLFIANVLQMTVLKDNDPSIVSPIIYSCPLFTLLLAYLLFNSTINTPCIIGSLLIVSGVLCISTCSDNSATKMDLNKLFKIR